MRDISPEAWIAPGAHVVGEVTLAADASVWYGAVVRADSAEVYVGPRSNVQDNAVIHVSEGHPVRVGADVTIGHGAIVHGCTVEDGALVGMGAIVLDGARVGKNSVVGAGALVTKGMEIPDGMVAFGSPARVVRPVTEADLAASRHGAAEYVALARANRKA